MKQEIDKIIKKNITKLEQNSNILSIFLVGSMASDDYKEKELNDYDIRFIVSEMNISTYEEINKALTKIKTEIEELKIGCQISDVIGPVKMVPKEKRNVLIHSITMTKKELDNLPNIHKYSYSKNYQHMYGEDLIDKYKKLIITPNDIINAVEGIDFCIELISKGQNSYSKWIIDDERLTLKREYVATSNIDMMELFYYSYNKAISNINNMIETNDFIVKLNNYLDFDEEERQLINKIETNTLSVVDINNKSIKIIQKILLKLAKITLNIYKDNKKYYNSLEWGIIDTDSRDTRRNGFDFLKRVKIPTGNNFSMSYNEYLQSKERIAKRINNSKYIVIFEPPNKEYKRYGVTNVSNIDEIDEYIINKNLPLEKYNVSFIEIIKETIDSFAGTVMTDGKGNTIIETISGTCDSRELTSTGAMQGRINTYRYISFDDLIPQTPSKINEIKEMCQYFKGYYEFAYGEIRGIKDVYFTYYSPNENYINVFEGGKIKCKNITK